MSEYKEKTCISNADYVRSLSVEELARLIYDGKFEFDRIPFCKEKPECDDIEVIQTEECLKCLVDWLNRKRGGQE